MSAQPTVIRTHRLLLRKVIADDAPFILELINDPDWHRYIGDRGIRTEDGARDFISTNFTAMYEREGFGLYLTVRKADSRPLGICGLVKRDGLHDVDLGFGFLPAFRKQAYAFEASRAVIDYAGSSLGLERLAAITAPKNTASIRLLESLGFTYQHAIRLTDNAEEISLYCLTNLSRSLAEPTSG